jgi:hypothetical protein
MKPRVLIATPVFDKPHIDWTNGITSVLRLTDAEYDVRYAKGCYVQTGRNQLVYEARRDKFDEIVFVDADIKSWGAQHIQRLRSHDVDIVAGCYAKKIPGEPQLTCHAATTERVGDLIRCNDLPGGFTRIKMHVFDAIEKKFPWRSFQHAGEEPKFEFFPMGLVGEGTPEALLNAIKSVIARPIDSSDMIDEIDALFSVAHMPSCRQLLGEDVYFCKLAREAGFTLWADTCLALRHIGEIGYPAKESAF